MLYRLRLCGVQWRDKPSWVERRAALRSSMARLCSGQAEGWWLAGVYDAVRAMVAMVRPAAMWGEFRVEALRAALLASAPLEAAADDAAAAAKAARELRGLLQPEFCRARRGGG